MPAKRKPKAQEPASVSQGPWFEQLSNTANFSKGQHIPDSVLAAALRACFGVRAKAAVMLGCAPETVYNRVRSSPILRRVMQEAAEVTTDLAEDTNLTALKSGDADTAKWILLNTRAGRERGYGEKREFNLSPTDLAALAAAFGGNPEALRGLDAALDTETPEEPAEDQEDDRSGASRGTGKAASRRRRG